MDKMNRSRQPKPVSQLLKKCGLKHDVTLVTELNSLLQSFLKQHNIEGCKIGNLQNGSLIVEIPNANWQMRLQFIRSELLTVLRQKSPSLKSIKIRVNPKLCEVKVTERKVSRKIKEKRAVKMPSDVANSFLALAEDADPELKSALQSLAKFSKK